MYHQLCLKFEVQGTLRNVNIPPHSMSRVPWSAPEEKIIKPLASKKQGSCRLPGAGTKNKAFWEGWSMAAESKLLPGLRLESFALLLVFSLCNFLGRLHRSEKLAFFGYYKHLRCARKRSNKVYPPQNLQYPPHSANILLRSQKVNWWVSIQGFDNLHSLWHVSWNAPWRAAPSRQSISYGLQIAWKKRHSSWQICKHKLKESPVTLLSQGFWVSETETSNRFVLSFPKEHSVLLMPFDKAAILRWLVSTSETAPKRHQQETIWKTDGPWRCLSKLPLIALQYYSKYVSLTYLMHWVASCLFPVWLSVFYFSASLPSWASTFGSNTVWQTKYSCQRVTNRKPSIAKINEFAKLFGGLTRLHPLIWSPGCRGLLVDVGVTPTCLWDDRALSFYRIK